jgi:hypothetical protein
MPSRMRSEWRGDELLEEIEHAARATVNETVDAARDDARETRPWQDDPRLRTLKSGRKVDTHLDLQIQSEHADPADPNPVAAFGYTRKKGFYGGFHEEGTTHEHAFPTIRPSADRQFPTFVERLRRRLR